VSQILRRMARSLVGTAVAVLDLVIVIIYRSMIYSQLGPRDNARIEFVTIFILFLGVLSVMGALTILKLPRLSAMSFLASGTGHLGLGILGIFSIGFPLILGGSFLIYMGITGRGSTIAGIAVPVVMLTILGLGIAFS
jgi:hypothetical protein